jgi:hypothetical protein
MDNGERGVRSSGVAMKHPVPSAGSFRHPSPGAGLSNRQDWAQWVINEPNKGFLFKAASMARV